MNKSKITIVILLVAVVIVSTISWFQHQEPAQDENKITLKTELVDPLPEIKEPSILKIPENIEKPVAKLVSTKTVKNKKSVEIKIEDYKPIPGFLEKSIQWLAEAQFENGGWGAGKGSAQQIRDPKAVQTDPATTAFSAMALLRSGHTLKKGTYAANIEKAVDYLLYAVENAKEEDMSITSLRGTQPQNKLGQNIDVSITLQFLAKILPNANYDKKLENRINAAMDKCIAKLENTQMADGSWNTAGWAPVLNSAMANNALEYSGAAGREVKKEVLDKSQKYQAGNYDNSSGSISSGKAAGVQLYALSSTQRATAQDALEVEEYIKIKSAESVDADAPPPPVISIEEIPEEEATYEYLKDSFSDEKARKLAKSYTANKAATKSLQNDAVLSGFGNNGGEEYLSYAMTSESLVASGDEKGWDEWHSKMQDRLARVQNPNGSWSGHHCITSPVFCTAAVVMTLTADRDVDLLTANAK
jgi:hypothetical protein